jgi:hypothetical protein
MRDNQAGPPVTYAVVPRPPTAAVEEALLPPPARQPRVRRRLVLTVLAVAVFVAALLVIGLDGLIPFGLLLAFSTDSDEQETRRSVILTPRNLDWPPPWWQSAVRAAATMRSASRTPTLMGFPPERGTPGPMP